MIDINELRRLAQAATPGPWVSQGRYIGTPRHMSYIGEVRDQCGNWSDTEKSRADSAFIAAANPAAISELLDCLEAAEADALEQARLNGMGSEREAALMTKLEAAEKERDECNRRRLEAADHFAAQTALMKEKCDALRAKIAAMEQQEPVAWTVRGVAEWVSNGDGTYSLGGCLEAVAPLPDDTQLYALPGAQTQPAPSINEGVRKVTLGFRWESEAQHHIPTIEIEFDPVSPDSPNDAKGWQDRDRIASMLSPESKP